MVIDSQKTMGKHDGHEDMAHQMEKRVHITPVSLDYDRIGQIFEEIAPDRVYILFNENPIESHESVNEEALTGVRSIVESKTTCYERDEVKEVPVNFYRFRDSLIESHRLIYQEDKWGNQVFANLSGGTKPVAIALAFACALNDIGSPFYYTPKTYNEEDGRFVSSGVVDVSFESPSLQLLGVTDIMPTASEKEEILLVLLSSEERLGVTDILVRMGRVGEEPPTTEEERSSRNSLQQRYHRHANQLVDEGLLDKESSEYRLTGTGGLIANLVSVKREVDEQTSLADF